MINFTYDFGFNKALINSNQGRNVGVDVTFERFLHKGYYYLANVSWFRSKYKTDDNIWRSIRYDKNLAVNLLGGKELMIGSNMRGINLRASYSGGERRSPLLLEASNEAGRPLFDEEIVWSLQDDFVTHLDVSITYRVNKKSRTGIWALQVKIFWVPAETTCISTITKSRR